MSKVGYYYQYKADILVINEVYIKGCKPILASLHRTDLQPLDFMLH